MTTQDPAELITAAQAGDQQALDQLLTALQPQLYRFSMKMCRHPEDAEDVLQDTLLSAARALDGFRGGSTLKTWLYTIARNACIKKRRKSKFAPERTEALHEVGGVADDGTNAEDDLQNAELVSRVHRAIATLPSDQREVLILRDIEGLSGQEVADVVGISLAAMKSRLHRARVGLREALSQPMPVGAACPDIRLTFSRYLEDELSADTCRAMQDHIDGCARCAAECNGLRDLLKTCSNTPAEVPEELKQRITATLREQLGLLRAS